MRQECNRHVAVYFTREEKEEFSRQLSRNTQDLETLTDRKKQVGSEFKAKIDAANADIFKIARLLNNGYEYRDVKCDVQLDTPRRGLKRIIRMDTGEVIEECQMSADELQHSLNFADETAVNDAADSLKEEAKAPGPAKQPEPPAEVPAMVPPPPPVVHSFVSEPVRISGSGDGWRTEIVVLETAAGFECEVSMEIGSRGPESIEGGSICMAESEAVEEAASRLYRAAQRAYAEASGATKRHIRDLMSWAADRMHRKAPEVSEEPPTAA